MFLGTVLQVGCRHFMTEFRAGVGEVNACYQNGFLLRVIEDQPEFIQKTACLFQVCLPAVLRETFLERTAKRWKIILWRVSEVRE